MSDEPTRNEMDRRTFVRRAGAVGAAGAMVWATPAITTVSRAFGQTAGSPDCGRLVETFDDMQEIPTPKSARQDDIVGDDVVNVWFESIANSGDTSVSLLNPSGVTGTGTSGTIPPNTPFAVYMIHAQSSTGDNSQTGAVEFSQPILGVTSTQNGLNATDKFSGVSYDSDVGRRFEEPGDPNGDSAQVAGNRVDVQTKQGAWPDQMRVFVACASPQ